MVRFSVLFLIPPQLIYPKIFYSFPVPVKQSRLTFSASLLAIYTEIFCISPLSTSKSQIVSPHRWQLLFEMSSNMAVLLLEYITNAAEMLAKQQ